jgi:ATP-binding cassette subfamily B protein
MSLWIRIADQLRPFRVPLLGILACSLLAAPIAMTLPVPLKLVVDSVIGSEPLPLFLQGLLPTELIDSKSDILIVALGILLLVTVFNQLQVQGSWLLSEYTGEQIVLRLRSQMFEQVQRLSLAYHDRDGLADSIYRIQYDAQGLYRLVVWGLVPLLTASLIFVGMLYVTVLESPRLAVVALCVSPIVVLLTKSYSRRLGQQWEHVKNLETSALAVIQEVLGAIRVVTAFRQEERELGRFIRHSTSGVSERIRVISKEGRLSFLIGLTFGIGTLLVLYIGVGEVQDGTLTLGGLLLVMSYLGQLYGPLQTVGRQIVAQQGSLVSVKRAFALLDQAPAVTEEKDAKPLARTAGQVAFRNVSFAYPSGSRVLHHVSFEVPAGARVAITGPTGSGKSTLMSLLTRFYDPEEGEILLDGTDLRAYRLSDLRSQFAMVLQEPVLFSTSIAANIAYARPSATPTEIVAAAQAANAHEFIVKLPHGYDTEVGERGAALSGGERQRISLARAFLKDAPILIMDEPTSSVDVVTEAGILEAMRSLMNGRTVFLITHRMSATRDCDMFFTIHDGWLETEPMVSVTG